MVRGTVAAHREKNKVFTDFIKVLEHYSKDENVPERFVNSRAYELAAACRRALEALPLDLNTKTEIQYMK